METNPDRLFVIGFSFFYFLMFSIEGIVHELKKFAKNVWILLNLIPEHEYYKFLIYIFMYFFGSFVITYIKFFIRLNSVSASIYLLSLKITVLKTNSNSLSQLWRFSVILPYTELFITFIYSYFCLFNRWKKLSVFH